PVGWLTIRYRQLESIQHKRDHGVGAYEGDEFHQAAFSHGASCRDIGCVVDSTLGEQLLRHRIDGVIVVTFERQFFPTPDRVNDGVSDPVLASHADMGPPGELRLPMGGHSKDNDLDRASRHRHLIAQCQTEVDHTSAYFWCAKEGFDRTR